MNVSEIIIIGSGPAGWTAAIYAARANLMPLLFEGLQPGGQLTMTTAIENFPGFSQGIQGGELMQQMKEQAIRFGTKVFSDRVTSVQLAQPPFSIVTENAQYSCRCLIIATGASSKFLGLDAEKKLLGRGVSTCATCDGFFFRGQEIAIIGGGDSALEEALFLTRYASKVYLIHRRETLRASKIMQDRLKSNEKIQVILNTIVLDILDAEQGSVKGLMLKNSQTGAAGYLLPVEGVFIAIGHQPNTDLFQGQLELDPQGYIVTRNGSETNIPGVFAAGDVHDTRYRQAITAAAAGCRAAMDAEKFLEATSH